MVSIEDRARTLGEALAARCSGSLVPAPSRPFPAPTPRWVLVLPRGFHAALVIESATGPFAVPWDGTELPNDVDAAARWLDAHGHRDEVTALELGIAACERLRRELDHVAWLDTLLGARTLRELHVTSEACYAHLGAVDRVVPRGRFDARLDALTRDLRTSVLAYHDAAASAERLGQLAAALVHELNTRVPTPDGSPWRMPPLDLRRTAARIYWGAGPTICAAEIALPGRFVIGDRALAIPPLDVPAMRDAIAERLNLVTSERLTPGERYRVIAPIAGASVGDVLLHVLTDWEHDRYEVQWFEDARGARVRLDDPVVLRALERHLARC